MMAPDNSTTEVAISEPETSQQTTEDEQPGTTSDDETPSLSIHTLWFKSLPGQLMCSQVVFSFLASVSIISVFGANWFFASVAIFSFLWAVCVVIVHLLQLYRKFAKLPWMTIEVITTAVLVLLWFVADMLILGHLDGASSGAAMMCGIFAFLASCGSVYFGVMDYLKEVRRQGTPMPSVAKVADRAKGGEGDSDSNSEDSLSEMPTVFPIS